MTLFGATTDAELQRMLRPLTSCLETLYVGRLALCSPRLFECIEDDTACVRWEHLGGDLADDDEGPAESLAPIGWTFVYAAPIASYERRVPRKVDASFVVERFESNEGVLSEGGDGGDGLITRVYDCTRQTVVEWFTPGRPDNLRTVSVRQSTNRPVSASVTLYPDEGAMESIRVRGGKRTNHVMHVMQGVYRVTDEQRGQTGDISVEYYAEGRGTRADALLHRADSFKEGVEGVALHERCALVKAGSCPSSSYPLSSIVTTSRREHGRRLGRGALVQYRIQPGKQHSPPSSHCHCVINS
jgi:hypothetical protein